MIDKSLVCSCLIFEADGKKNCVGVKMICFMCVQGYTNSHLSFVLFDFFNYFRTKWHACTNCYCFGVSDCGGGGERWLHGDDNRGNSGKLLGGTIGQLWKGAGRKEIWAMFVNLTMSVTGAIAVYGAEELTLFVCRIRIQILPQWIETWYTLIKTWLFSTFLAKLGSSPKTSNTNIIDKTRLDLGKILPRYPRKFLDSFWQNLDKS